MSDADALLLSIINLLGYDWWRQQHDARLDAWYEATLRHLCLVREIPQLDTEIAHRMAKAEEIEVTEEMVEAGVDAAYSLGAVLGSPHDSIFDVVAGVYRAMAAHDQAAQSPLDAGPRKSAPIEDTTT